MPRLRLHPWTLALGAVLLPVFVWAAFYFPGEGRLRSEIERLRAAGEPTSVEDFPAPPGQGHPDAAAWYALAVASRPDWDADDVADFEGFPGLAERGRRGEFEPEAARALADLEPVSERLRASRTPRAEWDALWMRVEALLTSAAPPATVGPDELVALRARVAGSYRPLECANQAGRYVPFAARVVLEAVEAKGISAAIPEAHEGLLTTRELESAVLAALWSGDEALAVRWLTAGFEVAHLHREVPEFVLAVASTLHWTSALDALERALPLLSPAADLGRVAEILAAAEPRRELVATLRVQRVLSLQLLTLAREGAEEMREFLPEDPVRRSLWCWMSGHWAADLLRHQACVLEAAALPASQRPPGSLPEALEGLSRFTSSLIPGEAFSETALLRYVDEREERILRAHELMARQDEARAAGALQGAGER